MSDRFAAEITIGGKIARTDFIKLFKVAEGEGLCLEWGDTGSMPDTPQELLEAVEPGEPLVLNDAEARYGMFEELEQFCFEHGIAYSRHSDARYEYDGEIAWWVPGKEQPRTTTATQDGAPTVCAQALGKLLGEAGTPEEKLARVAAYLDDHSPPDIPPLEVIDDGLDWNDWRGVEKDDEATDISEETLSESDDVADETGPLFEGEDEEE